LVILDYDFGSGRTAQCEFTKSVGDAVCIQRVAGGGTEVDFNIPVAV